jgi:hypothetical protein
MFDHGEGRHHEILLRVPCLTATTSRVAAEILGLLHGCGRGGLAAVQLSHFLYGDGAHVVTVRAEISRLRRTVGALISANPYRLAPDVAFEVVPGRAAVRDQPPAV